MKPRRRDVRAAFSDGAPSSILQKVPCDAGIIPAVNSLTVRRLLAREFRVQTLPDADRLPGTHVDVECALDAVLLGGDMFGIVGKTSFGGKRCL